MDKFELQQVVIWRGAEVHSIVMQIRYTYQHWAINLQQHADPATPKVDGCHFRYFSIHKTAFPF